MRYFTVCSSRCLNHSTTLSKMQFQIANSQHKISHSVGIEIEVMVQYSRNVERLFSLPLIKIPQKIKAQCNCMKVAKQRRACLVIRSETRRFDCDLYTPFHKAKKKGSLTRGKKNVEPKKLQDQLMRTVHTHLPVRYRFPDIESEQSVWLERAPSFYKYSIMWPLQWCDISLLVVVARVFRGFAFGFHLVIRMVLARWQTRCLFAFCSWHP